MEVEYFKLNLKEKGICCLIWIGISLFLAKIFYKSVAAAVVISLGAPLFIKFCERKKKEKRKIKITEEFKEMIRYLSMSIQAGESVENALYGMYPDMKTRFGEKAYMTKECEAITRGLRNNISAEKLLLALGERTDIDEIRDFTEIFTAAKKSGGNLREIICDTTEAINLKIEMKNEFRISMASKKLEQRIMCIVPFAIIAYIGVTSPGYFDSLYEGMTGRIVMTCCLAAYGGAFIWGEKILNCGN